MIIDRPQAKLAAKNCMRTADTSPYQIGLVFILITLALSAFDYFMMARFATLQYLDAYTTIAVPSPINMFVTILSNLIIFILQAGMITYALGVRSGHRMPMRSLFDPFSMAGKIVLLDIVMTFFITLWTMLFVIPGIIASYRYRFAIYNLLENPDLGVMEAINLSKQQTNGFKWQLFVLDLSFAGWAILNVLTMNLLGVWLIPYMTLTNIAFYDAICQFKGLHPSGSVYSSFTDSAPQDASPDSYNWDHQNSTWNEGSQSQSGPFDQNVPHAPDVPEAPQNGDEPWEQKNDSDPWNQK